MSTNISDYMVSLYLHASRKGDFFMAETSREKARYWVAIMYPENMLDNWEDEISGKVQVPFAYCIHDKCMEKDGVTPRKPHVHIILAFSNTTTYNHALKTFKRLEKAGCSAIPNDHIESIVGIRHMYDYLIHDTEDSRKKNKRLYDSAERITGNNFDIGSYEQLSAKDKLDMKLQLCRDIIERGFLNFTDFFGFVMCNYDSEYIDIVTTSSGLFERLTKGNYQNYMFEREERSHNTVRKYVKPSSDEDDEISDDE